jgi:hypothetical protein
MSLIVQEVSTDERYREEVLRSSGRNVILRDCKRAAEYSTSVDDQILIQTMAGEL